MQYTEFIRQPQIEGKFNSMFEEQKKYFMKKCSELGINNERLENIAIKMAFVSTDIYFSKEHFSEEHKNTDKSK